MPNPDKPEPKIFALRAVGNHMRSTPAASTHAKGAQSEAHKEKSKVQNLCSLCVPAVGPQSVVIFMVKFLVFCAYLSLLIA